MLESVGTIGMVLLSIAISFGIFTGLTGFFLSSSRLTIALGRANFIPKVFSTLHPRFNTPYIAVVFVLIVCLAAPWLGRIGLSWIVDMSSVGVSIAFFNIILVSVKFFSKQENKNMVFVTFGILGALISIFFLASLLIPASPAALTAPSYMALAAWCILGILFFIYQFKTLNSLTKQELDFLILKKQPRVKQ